MAQTVHPLATPIPLTIAAAGSWQTQDLDSYVGGLGADVTGVLLHFYNSADDTDYDVGAKHFDSTDDRHSPCWGGHFWGGCGVKADHTFKVYIGHITYVTIYIVAYTTTGFEWLTDGVDFSLGAYAAWTTVDTSATAPVGSLLLIFELINVDFENAGVRHFTSTDDRPLHFGRHVWLATGCDADRKCKAWAGDADVDMFLMAYATEGVIANVNAPDKSLTTTGGWTVMPALTAGAIMGFIEVSTTGNWWMGMRENGSTEDIKGDPGGSHHCMAIVKANTNRLLQGYISSAVVDFFEIAIATSGTVATMPVFLASYRRRTK